MYIYIYAHIYIYGRGRLYMSKIKNRGTFSNSSKKMRTRLEQTPQHHTKKKSLSACGSKSALGSRFGSGGIIQLSEHNYSFKGFWTAFLDHILSLRFFQSRSGGNHRNARNPMETNVKTHVNMCKSMESKKF